MEQIVKYRKKQWFGNSTPFDITMVFEIPEFEIPKILLSVIIGTVIKIHLFKQKNNFFGNSNL